MNIRELQKSLEEFIFVGQAHKLGVFDSLAENPESAAGLARRMRWDARATLALLDALDEMKYLKKSKDVYSVPAGVIKRLVEREGKQYEGDFWQFLYYLVNPWRTLAHVLKTGMPDRQSYKDFSMADFIRGMDSPWKKAVAPEIVDACLKLAPHAKSAWDIGGAPGTVAREFALRGIDTLIFDLPESNAVMGTELTRLDRVSVKDGDATNSLPEGTCDIAFLGNLCHGQSPEDNRKILRMCMERLNPKGIVVIFDNLKGEDMRAATLALHMITQSPAGNIYTRREYLGWLRGAGYRKLKVQKLADPAWSLVIGFR